MLVLAYLTSYFQGSDAPIGTIPSWHLSPASSPDTLSYAGWWFTSISLPVYRFLLFRWVWRMFLWAYFLRCVSKMKLVLIPTHPDMAAGLSFLSGAQQRLGTIAFAIGAVVAGQLGNAIAYAGATVAGLKYVILAYCVCATLILVTPLLLLVPALVPVKRRGLLDMERWRPVTRRPLMPSGSTGVRPQARRCWEVPTYSPLPTWGTASPSCDRCGWCLSARAHLLAWPLLPHCPWFLCWCLERRRINCLELS